MSGRGIAIVGGGGDRFIVDLGCLRRSTAYEDSRGPFTGDADDVSAGHEQALILPEDLFAVRRANVSIDVTDLTGLSDESVVPGSV